MKVKEAITKWFLTNACIRHGHPHLEYELEPTPPPPPGPPGPPGKDGKDGQDAVPKTIVIDKNENNAKDGDWIEGAVDAGRSAFWKKAFPWLLATALGAGGVVPWIAFFTGKTEDPPEQPTITERNGSLYQSLQDGNWHLPD